MSNKILRQYSLYCLVEVCALNNTELAMLVGTLHQYIIIKTLLYPKSHQDFFCSLPQNKQGASGLKLCP